MKRIIYMMVLGSMMVSCTNGGISLPTPPPDKSEVLVSFSSVLSKATETEFTTGDAVGVYALKSGKLMTDADAIYNGYENFKYRAVDGHTLSYADEQFKMYFPVDVNEKLDFVAYFPYSEAAKLAGNKLSVDISNQDIATNDYLLAMYSDNAKVLDKTSESVGLKFRFMMSKLVITLEKGIAMSEDQLVGVSLSVSNAMTSALINLNNLTFDNYAGRDIVIDGLVSDENKQVVLYLLPHAGNTGIVFSFSDKAGGRYLYTIPDSHNFEPSKQYNYKLTMNRTIVQPEATIEDWLPGEEREGEGNQE